MEVFTTVLIIIFTFIYEYYLLCIFFEENTSSRLHFNTTIKLYYISLALLRREGRWHSLIRNALRKSAISLSSAAASPTPGAVLSPDAHKRVHSRRSSFSLLFVISHSITIVDSVHIELLRGHVNMLFATFVSGKYESWVMYTVSNGFMKFARLFN